MAVEITSKIVGYRIKQQEQAVPVPELQDEDPLTVRIPSRPEGTLEAVSEKISYVGAEGRKKSLFAGVVYASGRRDWQ